MLTNASFLLRHKWKEKILKKDKNYRKLGHFWY